MSDSPEEEDLEHVMAAAMVTDEVVDQRDGRPWPPRTSLNSALPDSLGSPDTSPNGKGGPM